MLQHEMHVFDFDDSPADTDSLGFNRAAGNLAKQIDKSNLPLVLGLFGRWGAGKSTFLRLLADALQDQHKHGRRFFTVLFEPWKLEGSTSVLYDLVSTIHVRANETEATSPEGESVEKRLFMYLDDVGFNSFRDLIRSGIGDVAQTQIGLGDQVGELLTRFLRSTPYDIAKSRIEAATLLPNTFRGYLSTLQLVPVVLIDDLDRCQPETVVSLLEGLKLFFQARGSRIVYILAMDHEMIIKAVCSRYGFDSWRDGWQYLSKICNQTFFIPRPQIRGLLSSLANELRGDDDHLDLFWELLTSQPIEDLLYRCDLYLPRRLKRIVRHTHTALAAKALGLVHSIKDVLLRNREHLPVEEGVAEKACYRVLLGVFMLREAYPEVYSRIAYKTHERRADLLLELGTRASRFDRLEERQAAAVQLATEWSLSELHSYFADHVLLDLLAKLFNREEVIAGCPPEFQDLYEPLLRREILNPVLDILMSA